MHSGSITGVVPANAANDPGERAKPIARLGTLQLVKKQIKTIYKLSLIHIWSACFFQAHSYGEFSTFRDARSSPRKSPACFSFPWSPASC